MAKEPSPRARRLAWSPTDGLPGVRPTACRESDKEPAYVVGDRLRVKGDNPRGHTDKADYIRGKVGIVVVNDATYPPTCRFGT